jgi:hypothetical protein
MSNPEAAPDHGARMLGRLEGRVDALDERMTRHEATISARLASIDAKIDTMMTTLATGLGGVRVFHWIAGVLIAVGGFIANHFWHARN